MPPHPLAQHDSPQDTCIPPDGWGILKSATDGFAVWDGVAGGVRLQTPAWGRLLGNLGVDSEQVDPQISGQLADLTVLEASPRPHWITLRAGDRSAVRVRAERLHRPQHDWLLLLPATEGSATDAVTGAADRRALQEELEERYQTEKSFAALFIDLDGFKQVNDLLGHLSGDLALREVANRLAACLRPNDMLARFGGDEFVVLIDGARGDIDLEQVLECLDKAVSKPLPNVPTECKLGASMGWAFSGDGYNCPADLLAAADRRMYASKRQRKRTEALGGS